MYYVVQRTHIGLVSLRFYSYNIVVS